jgi:hypothetical protein
MSCSGAEEQVGFALDRELVLYEVGGRAQSLWETVEA